MRMQVERETGNGDWTVEYEKPIEEAKKDREQKFKEHGI